MHVEVGIPDGRFELLSGTKNARQGKAIGSVLEAPSLSLNSEAADPAAVIRLELELERSDMPIDMGRHGGLSHRQNRADSRWRTLQTKGNLNFFARSAALVTIEI